MIRSPWRRSGTTLFVGEAVAGVMVTDRITMRVAEAMNAEAKVDMARPTQAQVEAMSDEQWLEAPFSAEEQALVDAPGPTVPWEPIGRLVPRDLPRGGDVPETQVGNPPENGAVGPQGVLVVDRETKVAGRPQGVAGIGIEVGDREAPERSEVGTSDGVSAYPPGSNPSAVPNSSMPQVAYLTANGMWLRREYPHLETTEFVRSDWTMIELRKRGWSK